jgi:aldose 1-epimerase
VTVPAVSGRQIEIAYGDQRAVVVEQGGGVRSYAAAGGAVLDGYGTDEMALGARGQPLLPWPNRLHEGSYTWEGLTGNVPLDEPDQRNALHGLGRWRSWTVVEAAVSTATMGLRLLPSPAYPFALDLAVRYDLDRDGLTVATTARNVGAVRAPYGHGAHPYLTVGTALVDDALLHLPAATWLPTDDDQIPVGREPVDGTAYDFRVSRAVGQVTLDLAFTDLDRDPAGRAHVALFAPDGGRRVTMWLDEHYRYVEVFTGDTLPEKGRRRQGLGLEPMTCPPDAFRSGTDVIALEPGQSVTTRWGLRPS